MGRSFGARLDPSSAEPIYKQIFDQVVDRIRSESLPVGSRLPPTRRLAVELNTHRNTVVRAYEELATAGYVHSVVGRGTFVCDRPGPAILPGEAAGPRLPWASLISRTALSEPLGRLDRLRRSPVATAPIDLSRMQPPDELLPHDLLRRCFDHVMHTAGPRSLGYAPREGIGRLRELVVQDLARLGMPARLQDVIVTTGSQQALDLIARTLVDPGDRILVEDATYAGAISLFATAGAQLVSVPSDGEGPDPSALGQLTKGGGVKGLYLMPNCHNPLGTSISRQRRDELIAWSHDAGVPLIEDDYAADLNLDGLEEPAPMRALDSEIIHLGTFSKKLIPALRIGYLVVPPGLWARIVALKQAMDLGTSALTQHVLAEFLTRGYLGAHLRRSRPIYRARRDALESALRAFLPDVVRWQHQQRGVALWLRLPADLDPEAVFEEAQRHGILVNPGNLYTVDRNERGGLRLCFCYEPPARLKEGARRLGRAIEALLRRTAERPDPSQTVPLDGA